jgi:pilus assembly protein Flp/PilA
VDAIKSPFPYNIDKLEIKNHFSKRKIQMFKLNRNKNEKGQGLVEYALILVLVAIVVIAVLMLLGPIIGGVFSTINDSLSGVGGGVAAASADTHPGRPTCASLGAEGSGYYLATFWSIHGGGYWVNGWYVGEPQYTTAYQYHIVDRGDEYSDWQVTLCS